MAKILKIRIKRTQKITGTFYTYPPEYDSRKIQVLVYESSLKVNEQSIINRGNQDEYLIGVVRDSDAPGFLSSSNVEEIDYSTAVDLGNLWRPQVVLLTGPQNIVDVLLKVHNKKTLTKLDKKVINPDDSTPGLIKSRSFINRLNNAIIDLS